MIYSLESDFRRRPGRASVRVTFRSEGGESWTFSSGRYKVNPERDLLDSIEERLGQGSVRLEVAG